RAGDLHAVARVTRKADDDRVALLDRLGTRGYPVRHLGRPPRPPWALNLLRVFGELRSKTRTPSEDSVRPDRLQLGKTPRRAQPTRRTTSACGFPFLALCPTTKVTRVPGPIPSAPSSHCVTSKKIDSPSPSPRKPKPLSGKNT